MRLDGPHHAPPPDARQWLEQLVDEGVVTPRMADALLLHSRGLGFRTIAAALGLAPSSVRDRCRRGEQKIAAHLAKQQESAE